MAKQAKQPYKVSITGPGHSFERDVDELTATSLINLAVTGKVETASAGGAASTGGAPTGGAGSGVPAGAKKPAGISLASHIKAKKGDKNQVVRFLATAQWMAARGEELITASAVKKALSDHNQKGLSNAAESLNKNVGKGFAEKRKDGSFFITPEGLESLDGVAEE
jgi:hypothetical protein